MATIFGGLGLVNTDWVLPISRVGGQAGGWLDRRRLAEDGRGRFLGGAEECGFVEAGDT